MEYNSSLLNSVRIWACLGTDDECPSLISGSVADVSVEQKQIVISTSQDVRGGIIGF